MHGSCLRTRVYARATRHVMCDHVRCEVCTCTLRYQDFNEENPGRPDGVTGPALPELPPLESRLSMGAASTRLHAVVLYPLPLSFSCVLRVET